MPHVAVVGGGVSGLAAAHRVSQILPSAQVSLLEAGDRLGGPLDTHRGGELLYERGADSFLTRDDVAVQLCEELGLADELLPTSAENRRALVVCRGRLEPIPEGFVLMQPHRVGSILWTRLLSAGGKVRLLAEPFVRRPAEARNDDYDESVASFAARRLGREAFERLVEPLLAGIYVADAAKLSLAATMPEFLAAERDFGSLARGRRAEPSKEAGTGARYAAFVTPRRGLGSLVDALEATLPADWVERLTAVTGVHCESDSRWRVEFGRAGAQSGAFQIFDGVILATPAHASAQILSDCDVTLADRLGGIESAGSVVVTLVYRRERIAHPLDAFGFVVPRIENRPIVAASFPSVKFAERHAANELTPIRVFLGGALRPELLEWDDSELIDVCRRELADLIGARGEPVQADVARWPASMPQYEVGHLRRVAEIESRVATLTGLELAGASYRGVGIPQCIRSGREAAERLAVALARDLKP